MQKKPMNQHLPKHQQMARQSPSMVRGKAPHHGGQKQITSSKGKGTKMCSPVK